jgi:hypothetical protein
MSGQIATAMGASSASLQIFLDKHSIERVPTEIKSVTDARYVIHKHESAIENDEANLEVRRIVLDFHAYAKKIVTQIQEHIGDADYIDFPKVFSNFKDKHNYVKHELAKAYISVLEQNINPILYFSAKKHYIISKILIENLDESDLKVEKFKENVKNADKLDTDILELGIFIGLEQIIVISAFSLVNRDDPLFISEYSKLANKFTYMISKKYPKQYLENLQLSKYSEQEYKRFIQNLISTKA